VKDYKFISPKKNRAIYIIINTLIVASIILIRFIYEEILYVAIPITAMFLFNGLWSINRKWYSFIHRDDESYYNKYVWLIFMILGILCSTLLIIYVIL
jgi:hypothetical protein